MDFQSQVWIPTFLADYSLLCRALYLFPPIWLWVREFSERADLRQKRTWNPSQVRENPKVLGNKETDPQFTEKEMSQRPD
jgi:hypothetical protein